MECLLYIIRRAWYDKANKGGSSMKRIISLLLCCMMLSGCAGNHAEATAPTQLTEISTTTEIIDPTTPPSTEEQTPHEKDAIVETTLPFITATTEETTPPEIIRYTVYSPNDNADGFYVNVMEWQIHGESDYQPTILEAWIELHVLTNDVQILSMVRDESHITIDFNHAFKDLICTMGTSGERMIIGSVVNTLIANYDVETVSITVEGYSWESGHVIYDSPMDFFE